MNKFIISLVISSLIACSVNAQETDLKTTLEATYANNPLIAQQREMILKLNESVVQQSSLIMPGISATLSQNLDDNNGNYANSAIITIKQLTNDGANP